MTHIRRQDLYHC